MLRPDTRPTPLLRALSLVGLAILLALPLAMFQPGPTVGAQPAPTFEGFDFAFRSCESDKTGLEFYGLNCLGTLMPGFQQAAYLSIVSLPGREFVGAFTSTSGGGIYPNPGEYEITVTLGEQSVTQKFQVEAGEVLQVFVTQFLPFTNVAPVANADSYATDEDVPLTIPAATGVLANDTDADGDGITVDIFNTTIEAERLTVERNGGFTYRPRPDASGTETFSYRAMDIVGAFSGYATVTITVNAVNDPPVIRQGDRVTLNAVEDGPIVTISLDATDAEGAYLVAALAAPFLIDATTRVSFPVLSTDFQPDPDAFGIFAYGIEVSDGSGGTDYILVEAVVAPVNDAPSASDDTLAASDEDAVRTISGAALSANDSAGPLEDAVDSLTVTAVDWVVGGTASVIGGGVTFTPAPNATGPAGFRYTVTDAGGLTATATATFALVALPDAPVVDSGSVPADLTREATGPGGANVGFEVPSATSAVTGDPVVVTCDQPGDSAFPLGTTVVTCRATDDGATASVSFDITVVDTTPPLLSVPAEVIAEATGGDGAPVTFPATATDLVDLAITPTCTPPSGSLFARGTTTVTCTATDAARNTSSATFTVRVADSTGPVIRLIGGPQPNVAYPRASLPAAPICQTTDAASIVTQCTVTGYSTAVGRHTMTVRARDTAGNATVVTRSYTVTGGTAGPAPTITPSPTRPTTPTSTATGTATATVPTATATATPSATRPPRTAATPPAPTRPPRP